MISGLLPYHGAKPASRPLVAQTSGLITRHVYAGTYDFSFLAYSLRQITYKFRLIAHRFCPGAYTMRIIPYNQSIVWYMFRAFRLVSYPIGDTIWRGTYILCSGTCTVRIIPYNQSTVLYMFRTFPSAFYPKGYAI